MVWRRCHCILWIVFVCISIIKGCESIEDCPDGSYTKVTQPAPVPQHLGRARLVCNFVHDPEITGPLSYLEWSMQDTTLYVYSPESKNIDSVLEPDVVVNCANDYNAGAGHSEILINTQVGDYQTYSCKVFFKGHYHCIHGRKLEFEGLYDVSTTKNNVSFRGIIAWLLFFLFCIGVFKYAYLIYNKRRATEHQVDMNQDAETGPLPIAPDTVDSPGRIYNKRHLRRPIAADSSDEDTVDSHAMTYDKGPLPIAPEDVVDSPAMLYNKTAGDDFPPELCCILDG